MPVRKIIGSHYTFEDKSTKMLGLYPTIYLLRLYLIAFRLLCIISDCSPRQHWKQSANRIVDNLRLQGNPVFYSPKATWVYLSHVQPPGFYIYTGTSFRPWLPSCQYRFCQTYQNYSFDFYPVKWLFRLENVQIG